MIKITPQIYTKAAKLSECKQTVQKVKPQLDFSGEEYGYFKAGDKIVKTTFPR